MATKAATVETTDPVETLDPVTEEKFIQLGEGDTALVFEQKPLSFFGKIEFFSLVGKAVEKVLSEGTTLGELLDVPNYDSSVPLASSASEADVFIKALSRVVQNAPEILSDLYCVILAVPRAQRAYVSQRLEAELTDEQGMEILDTFIDQNWEVMVSFFKERILPLADKITTKVRG